MLSMGALNDAKKEAGNGGFVKAADLYLVDAAFTILGIEYRPQGQFGASWLLKIEIYPETINRESDIDHGLKEVNRAMFSFGAGSRNDFMKSLEPKVPVYNCFIDNKPTRAGNDFYDLCELDEGDSRWRPEPKRKVKVLGQVVTVGKTQSGKIADQKQLVRQAVPMQKAPKPPVRTSRHVEQVDPFLPDYEEID